ncbi:MAG: hypothetical protein WC516_06030 [Patescibacteria group bacterium]|jgi:hypothetical protein
MKDLIKRVKESNLEDEQLSKEVIITLLTKVDEIYRLLKKKSIHNCQTDPTKLKKGDILIGGKE